MCASSLTAPPYRLETVDARPPVSDDLRIVEDVARSYRNRLRALSRLGEVQGHEREEAILVRVLDTIEGYKSWKGTPGRAELDSYLLDRALTIAGERGELWTPVMEALAATDSWPGEEAWCHYVAHAVHRSYSARSDREEAEGAWRSLGDQLGALGRWLAKKGRSEDVRALLDSRASAMGPVVVRNAPLGGADGEAALEAILEGRRCLHHLLDHEKAGQLDGADLDRRVRAVLDGDPLHLSGLELVRQMLKRDRWRGFVTADTLREVARAVVDPDVALMTGAGSGGTLRDGDDRKLLGPSLRAWQVLMSAGDRLPVDVLEAAWEALPWAAFAGRANARASLAAHPAAGPTLWRRALEDRERADLPWGALAAIDGLRTHPAFRDALAASGDVDVLMRLVEDGQRDASVRFRQLVAVDARAALALATDLEAEGRPLTPEVLRPLLGHEDVDVRQGAVRLLGRSRAGRSR